MPYYRTPALEPFTEAESLPTPRGEVVPAGRTAEPDAVEPV